jgi:hypothetical protein
LLPSFSIFIFIPPSLSLLENSFAPSDEKYEQIEGHPPQVSSKRERANNLEREAKIRLMRKKGEEEETERKILFEETRLRENERERESLSFSCHFLSPSHFHFFLFFHFSCKAK